MKLDNQDLCCIRGGGGLMIFARVYERIVRAIHIRYLMHILFVD